MAEPKQDASSEAKQGTPAPVVANQSATTQQPVEDAPDPEEDNLDDLDDMLDEFSTTNTAPATVPAASGPGRPSSAKEKTTIPAPSAIPGMPNLDDMDSEEFNSQLQKEMEALMTHVDQNPEMKAQMESLFNAMVAETEKTGPLESPEAAMAFVDNMSRAGNSKETEPQNDKSNEKTTAKPSTEKASGEETFQETIRKTMERMKLSEDQADAAVSENQNVEGDLLAQLMKELASGEGGEGSEEDFSKMLLGMMEQLTNKEILYEPMKDLYTRFPEWLEKNKGKVDQKDYERYTKQSKIVKEIIERFEKEGYSDQDTKDREYIVERMQEMQAQGAPPSDLVGNMDETQSALGDLDAGCPQQ